MSARGQRTLFAHLTDPDSLEVIAKEGLALDVIPTADLRPILVWALDYFYASGMMKAPTELALREHDAGGNRTYGDILDANEVVLGDVEESIEWALDDLRASFIHKESVAFQKGFAKALAEAPADERVEVVGNAATELVRLTTMLERRDSLIDAKDALGDRIHAFEARASAQGVIDGLTFGMPQIDTYTSGIHPGELCIVGAPPKTGKSYLLDYVALKSWQAGDVPALETLENTVEMTLDRIACMAAMVDPGLWQRGELPDEGVERVRHWLKQLTDSSHPLWIIRPDLGKRTVEHMVRQAHILEADNLLIDQLSWIEWTSDPRRPKHERIGDGLHILGSMIGSGRKKLPCVVAHQINREGVRKARKTGWLDMDDLAESAEIERTADWVFGLYATLMERSVNQMKFQTLAARREIEKHFQLNWQIKAGLIQVSRDITNEVPQ